MQGFTLAILLLSWLFCWFLEERVREGNGTPLQYSCLENPMDGGAWWEAVHGVARSRTGLRNFTFTFMHWRRKWQPTPMFLRGESQGQGSLVGFRLWGCTESDTTKATQRQQQQQRKDYVECWQHVCASGRTCRLSIL